MLKYRGKGQRSNFAPVENYEYIFWSKFGGIAPIPPAPVEGQRSKVTYKGQGQRSRGAPWRIGPEPVSPPAG